MQFIKNGSLNSLSKPKERESLSSESTGSLDIAGHGLNIIIFGYQTSLQTPL